MKTRKSIAAFIIAGIWISSCQNNQQGDPAQHYEHETSGTDSSDYNVPNRMEEDSVARAAGQLPPPGKIDSTGISSSIDESFVNEAAGGGMMEVTLGQLAQQKATNPRIKAFGAMMVADHTKANNELKLIAGAKSHTLPAAPPEQQQKHINNLNKKQREDFDLAYIKMMVDDHQKKIREFQTATEKVSDTTVKAFARRTLPVLRRHLDSAQAIYRGLHGR